MIVDTSVLVAILFGEPERPRFQQALVAAEWLGMSAGSWIELTVVLSRSGRIDLLTAAEQLREELAIEIVAVDAAQARAGCRAYLQFGRGSGHPARLNYGDCFSYALAKATNAPLMFKGDDFGLTDVVRWNG